MAEGISVGSVSVSVVPDMSRFPEEMRARLVPAADDIGRQIGQRISAQVADGVTSGIRDGANRARAQSAQAGQSSGGAFADAFKARVTAALRDLPDAKIGADATAFDAKLADIRARLEALSNAHIGVDMDAAAALAEIKTLQAELDRLGAKSPDINVRVDAVRASAELAAIKAEVDSIDGDKNITVTASVGEALSGLGGVTGALAALGPALIPIGAAATTGLAGIATAAASGAAGLGVLALGAQQVTGAVKGLEQEHTLAAQQAARSAATEASAASAQVAAAQQVRQAQEALANARANADNQAITAAEQVKNARQSLADAEVTAAQQEAAAALTVQNARYALAQADQQEADAQQRLNAAREQAARDLESAANRARDAVLNQQQATINVQQAEANYASTMTSASATTLQKQQAALDLAKAQQALVEANQEVTNSEQDNAAAQQAGVNGAPSVVAAAQAVAAAKHNQAQAAQSLATAEQAAADAQTKAAEQVAKAAQALSDAERAQATQRRQSAFSVEQAQNSLTTALRAQATAGTAAGTAGVAALAKVQDQLAKTNPAALAFAHFWVDVVTPAFHQLATAASGFLPGLQAGLLAMRPLFGPLVGFVGGLATSMGWLFQQAGRTFTSPFWRQFFDYVSATAGPTLVTMAQSIGGIAQGLAGIMEAFAPLVNELGSGIARMTASFAQWGAGLAQSAGFQHFLAYVHDNGPRVMDLLGNLFTIAGHLLTALAPLGQVVLIVVDAFSKLLASMDTTQLLEFVAGVGLLIGVLSGGAGLAVAVVALAGLIVTKWGPIKDFFIGLWNDIVGVFTGAWRAITGAFSAAWDWVSGFFRAHWDLIVGIIGGPIGLAVTETVKHWAAIQGAFSDAWHWVSGVFASAWDGLRAVLMAPINLAVSAVQSIFGKGGPLQSAFSQAVSALGSIWNGLRALFEAPIRFAIGTVLNHGLIKAWDWIVDNLPGAKGLHVNPVPLPFSTGGVLPGYSPGIDTIPAMLSPGEAILRPEVTRALGAPTIHAWNAAARTGRLAHFDGGGIAGGVENAASSVFGAITGAASAVADPVKWLASKFTAPLHALDRITSTLYGRIVAAVPKGAADELLQWAKSLASKALGVLDFGGAQLSRDVQTKTLQKWTEKMLPRFGWDGAQMPPLISLWNQESGWRWNATNPSSGAYGIPQALPPGKMASAGADWRTNPLTQIMWGLGYIHDRPDYGSPAAAWAHEQQFGWYDQGGLLPPGPSLVYNGTGSAELVAPRQSFEQVMSGVADPEQLHRDLDRVHTDLVRLIDVAGQQGVDFAAALQGTAQAAVLRNRGRVG